jgi:hypothetical protein
MRFTRDIARQPRTVLLHYSILSIHNEGGFGMTESALVRYDAMCRAIDVALAVDSCSAKLFLM